MPFLYVGLQMPNMINLGESEPRKLPHLAKRVKSTTASLLMLLFCSTSLGTSIYQVPHSVILIVEDIVDQVDVIDKKFDNTINFINANG